jgi:hypothetical protein
MRVGSLNPRHLEVARVYSHSVWIVKAGREDEFISRWLDLARWSAREGRASGQLLRDVDRPERFVSLGPWRALQGFGVGAVSRDITNGSRPCRNSSSPLSHKRFKKSRRPKGFRILVLELVV